MPNSICDEAYRDVSDALMETSLGNIQCMLNAGNMCRQKRGKLAVSQETSMARDTEDPTNEVEDLN
ncbi:hypothetical protein CFIMG_005607RA [Ceratocystis fimbriata CBS 114723]|uniref:Uncharacterized protein n=1 Tax=Ceratocystis fimbriata CBS 114723 TaxID=1035309 RepID=A0A2C5X2V5_9PEZI|nr:hypothetical protein CFIMG_005607RA [Ceratocystis fimbriata CBS 114723]